MMEEKIKKCLFRESEGVYAAWLVSGSCFSYLIYLPKVFFRQISSLHHNLPRRAVQREKYG